MTYQFDLETAAEQTADGRWKALLTDCWNIGDFPNGGYLVASTLQPIRQLCSHPDPISVTAHFLRPGAAGTRADLTESILRAGRSVTTARAGLSQKGTKRLEVLAAFGSLDSAPGHGQVVTEPMPDMPPPEDCVSRSGLEQGVELKIRDRVDMRVHPQYATATTLGQAETIGWIRFADGREPDTLSAVLFADAFPPPIFGLLGQVGWVPTIELTVHVRQRPAPGWVCGRFVTEDLHAGRMIESGTLWDSTGALFARSRQLAMLLPEVEQS
ncbi:MAG: thioesterase family protein [Acidimicrobiales bacterium]|nr:thioesterase family protein [Acidimicrobiales bacterium]